MSRTVIAMAALAVLVSACSIDVEANPDGSLTVQSVLLESDMQEAIGYTIDDPEVERLDIEFFDGYATVDGRGVDSRTGDVNEVSFEVRLSVVDGHLGADISNGIWNGFEMPRWIVEAWNEAIARQLEAEGRKDPNSTLTSVTLTDDALTMEWRVEER